MEDISLEKYIKVVSQIRGSKAKVVLRFSHPVVPGVYHFWCPLEGLRHVSFTIPSCLPWKRVYSRWKVFYFYCCYCSVVVCQLLQPWTYFPRKLLSFPITKSPGVCSVYPGWWCYPSSNISTSHFFCLQSFFPASVFQWVCLFTSGGRGIGLLTVLMDIRVDFLLELTGLISFTFHF